MEVIYMPNGRRPVRVITLRPGQSVALRCNREVIIVRCRRRRRRFV